MHSPASGVRRHSPHAVVFGASVPDAAPDQHCGEIWHANGFANQRQKPSILEKARYYRVFPLAKLVSVVTIRTPTP